MYYVWITLKNNSTTIDLLVSTLLNIGYLVAASSSNGETLLNDPRLSSSIISLQLSHNDAEHNSQMLYDDIVKILTELNIKYLSLVIAPTNPDTRWGLGNCEDNISVNTNMLN